MYISSDNEKGVVRGKLGQSGIHCIKTQQTFIICIYDEPILPSQTAPVTEALGEYLVGVGY
jgi:profilin